MTPRRFGRRWKPLCNRAEPLSLIDQQLRETAQVRDDTVGAGVDESACSMPVNPRVVCIFLCVPLDATQ